MTRYYLALLITLSLVACGEDPVLPPASPLAVDSGKIDALYGALPGPYRVSTHEGISLPGASGRQMSVSLHFPARGSSFPLLLFSHGNWSNQASYDRIIHYWVSHGYVVVSTDHADCCSPVQGIFNSLRYGQLGLITRRIEDLEALLAGIPALEQQVHEFVGKADRDRVAATGHSFGAFSAQQLGGGSAMDPDTGKYRYQVNPAISAVVAISPPGPMFDTITAESWRGLELPTLVTTGTWDVQKGFWEQYQDHLLSWENSPAGNKYALVVEGADHYLGNLICRTEREAQPQEDALRMVQLTTLAFLDAELKNIAAARALLEGDLLSTTTGGFARLSRR